MRACLPAAVLLSAVAASAQEPIRTAGMRNYRRALELILSEGTRLHDALP